jgi:hypothetical protein
MGDGQRVTATGFGVRAVRLFARFGCLRGSAVGGVRLWAPFAFSRWPISERFR